MDMRAFLTDFILHTYNSTITLIKDKHLVEVLLILILGLFVAKVASVLVVKSLPRQSSPHVIMLLQRLTFWPIVALFIIAILDNIGFELTKLWAAGGVIAIAIGLASQTAMSNIINGIFLLTERPFMLGDFIVIDPLNEIEGEVLSIDLLSIKIRTFQNTMYRIPNEVLVKSGFTNLSRFPIRRLDIVLRPKFTEDLDKLKTVLMNLAKKQPLALESPEPKILFLGYEEATIKLKFCVWSTTEQFYTFKTNFYLEIQQTLTEMDIEIPVPQRKISISDVPEGLFPPEENKPSAEPTP